MPRIWSLRRQHQAETAMEAETRLKRERRELALDYRQTFASPAGQRVLADILRRGSVMQTSFDPHAATAAYNEGKRRLALEVVEMLNADPGQLDRLALTGDTEELYR